MSRVSAMPGVHGVPGVSGVPMGCPGCLWSAWGAWGVTTTTTTTTAPAYREWGSRRCLQSAGGRRGGSGGTGREKEEGDDDDDADADDSRPYGTSAGLATGAVPSEHPPVLQAPAVEQALDGHCLMRATGGLLAALSSTCGERAHDLVQPRSHVWRMMHYNPLAATAGERVDEIELACSNFDAITLVGTQRRTKERMEQSRSGSRWRIDAGWSAGSMTNKSTGVLISFGAKIRQKTSA